MARFSKQIAFVLLLTATACGAEATVTDEDDGAKIARDVCVQVTSCVSSIVTVEECVQIKVDCRDLLDDPEAWDAHMLECLELSGCEEGGSDGTAFVQCVQSAPTPAECASGRP